MFPDGEDADDEGENKKGDVPSAVLNTTMIPRSPESEEGQGTRRDDGGERNIAGDEKDDEKEKDEDKAAPAGMRARRTPREVAIPLPPLKPSQGEKLCPRIAKRAVTM